LEKDEEEEEEEEELVSLIERFICLVKMTSDQAREMEE